MIAEEDKKYTRAAVGLRLYRDDFDGAEDILDTLSTDTQDDEWYMEIMRINLKIEDADTLYQLTPTEEVFCHPFRYQRTHRGHKEIRPVSSPAHLHK